MSSLPFDKALLYVAVVDCKMDGAKLLLAQDKYFRGYFFSDPPYTRITMQLSKAVVPKAALAGKLSGPSLIAFLKKFDILDLYEAFQNPNFISLIGNPDLRVKLDILRMCDFSEHEIIDVAKSYDPIYTEEIVSVYLKCFADFSGMNFNEKQSFIVRYVEMSHDKDLYRACLENRSKEYIRVALGVNFRAPDPIGIVKRVAAINDMQLTRSLTSNDTSSLHKAMTLALAIASKLQSVGAGNKSAMEELMEVLGAKYESSASRPMTVEELDLEFRRQQESTNS